MSITSGEIVDLTVERLAYHSGHGVARHDGFVVFVPRTAPGDQVQARITLTKANYAEAELIRIIMSSPQRRSPPCPVADRCGGCPWQQVSYDEQIRQKSEILVTALRPLAPFGSFELLPFIPSPQEFRYRNRIQVHRHGDRVGFYAKGSHQLIEIGDCLITEEAIAAQIPALKSRGREQGAPFEERLEIARTKQGSIVVSSRDNQTEAALFSQVNDPQNQRLIQLALAACRDHRFDTVFDLYCGAGNFTFPLADQFPDARVWGVELSASSLAQAQAEQEQRGLSPQRMTWSQGSVGKVLSSTTRPKGTLLALIDPPRPGCDQLTRREILRLRPDVLVYVSCNPSTFVRDVRTWLESKQLKLKSVQGLDMFPQTAHLELIAVLQSTGL